MQNSFIETKYPINFRGSDAKQLGEFIRLRHSVELVGMKRVGISNFLRFFLNHKKIVPTYINHGEKHIFIPIDLNDLHEITLFPFWILTFKRLVDAVESISLSLEIKNKILHSFTTSIQTQDVFLTIESVRKALIDIAKEDFFPTIFFLRFDRLQQVVTAELFANLRSLQEATGYRLSYVFTSYKTLGELYPLVFSRKNSSVFTHPLYVKPALEKDIRIIFSSFTERYNISLSKDVMDMLIKLTAGHVQYLQLALIIINQKLKSSEITKNNLAEILLSDERINLQSEELWESLTSDEHDVLSKIIEKKSVDTSEDKARYLLETGFIVSHRVKIFSPLFENYLSEVQKNSDVHPTVDLTKKENSLFTLLKNNIDAICEREDIISNVWPEYEEYGVSDWTIDKLVARLRDKLKKQEATYKIVTVKTRGYKLVSEV